jgi:hypothetical protein
VNSGIAATVLDSLAVALGLPGHVAVSAIGAAMIGTAA